MSDDLNYKVLVVEDELEICRLLEIILTKKNFKVTTVNNGLSALSIIKDQKFDLILLDWMIPELSGFELLQNMRNLKIQTPVIMLTAKSQSSDIIHALNKGADDFISKPFDSSVLMARVESLLRRSQLSALNTKTDNDSTIKFRTLQLNKDSFIAYLDQKNLTLTRSEFLILVELVQNSEKVLTREHLVEVTQGEGISVTNRTIDTHIVGLRKKMGSSGSWIETIRGIGYRSVPNK